MVCKNMNVFYFVIRMKKEKLDVIMKQKCLWTNKERDWRVRNKEENLESAIMFVQAYKMKQRMLI